MNKQQDDSLRRLIAAFASKYIATRPDLSTPAEFPADVWQEMGKAGLFKIAVPEIYGGAGGGYPELVSASEALVRYGFNLGLAFSWTYQQIIVRYIIDLFGSGEIKRQWLPELAAGKLTLSFAVSEPGHGAHPKRLSTRAIRQENTFILDGEKTYLTNGPHRRYFYHYRRYRRRGLTQTFYSLYRRPADAGCLHYTADGNEFSENIPAWRHCPQSMHFAVGCRFGHGRETPGRKWSCPLEK